ncbi:hypothetical protein AMI01nite_05900 [Aneurinibacillus migulanus]|nr:hypothetical protein AMI01nite_05900 [Aneurinibacillus migulanus]
MEDFLPACEAGADNSTDIREADLQHRQPLNGLQIPFRDSHLLFVHIVLSYMYEIVRADRLALHREKISLHLLHFVLQ